MIHEGCFCGRIRIRLDDHTAPGTIETVYVRCDLCPPEPDSLQSAIMELKAELHDEPRREAQAFIRLSRKAGEWVKGRLWR